MTTPTLLAAAEVVPYTPDTDGQAPPYNASGTPLPDGTILLAWESREAVVITRRTRDLTTELARTTAPRDTTGSGVELWVGTDGTPVLATATRSWTITPDPLTATPGPTHAEVEWYWARGRATVGDATVLLGNYQAIIHRPGTPLVVIDTPDDVSSVWDGGDGTACLAIHDYIGDDRVAQVWRLDTTTGALTLTTSTPLPDSAYSGPVAVPDGAWLGMDIQPDGYSRLHLRDQAGALVIDPAWPPTSAYLHASITSTHLPDGSTLAAIFYGPDGHAGLAHATPDSLDVTALTLATTEHVQGTTTDAAPLVAHHGGTALVLIVGYRRASDTGHPHNEYGLTAWTLDLGHDGILDVPTIDGWWTIGTRDPQMQWEFLVPTPLGWWVEIVAGEEHLADMELAVPAPTHPDAGEDGWVVVALMRPDTA